MEQPRVVVTGLGAVAPNGIGLEAFARSLRAGAAGGSGLSELTPGERGMDEDQAGEPRVASRVASRVGAVARAWDPTRAVSSADVKRLPRCVPMAIAAAREAAWRAGLIEANEVGAGLLDAASTTNPEDTARSIGVFLGTGAGGIDFTLDQAKAAYAAPSSATPAERDAQSRDRHRASGATSGAKSVEESAGGSGGGNGEGSGGGRRGGSGRGSGGGRSGGGRGVSLWTITNATHGNLAGEISIALGAKGPSVCVSNGCASASDAVGQALQALRSDRPGTPAAVVVVGADAHIRWETLLGMELLGVISTRDPAQRGWSPAQLSRPFDADRDGFVLGEGAWAAVLERADHAQRRGARVLATLDGYAATCDAYHRVRPDPEMTESTRAMRLAIDDAGWSPDAVEVLHYHGTATPMNDVVETKAVRNAFGVHADRLRGHSVKGLIGHPQGASGLAALVSTLAGLTDADAAGAPFLFPTANLAQPGEGCDLDYTPNEAAPARGDERFMINCLAFGARNSVLVGRAGPTQHGKG